MAVVGPIARCVADLELVASVLAGPDGIDTEVPPVPWQRAPALRATELRIACLPSFPEVPTARDVRATVERTARALAASGAHVEERDPGVAIAEINAVWRDYFPLVASTLLDVSGATLPVKAPDGPPATLSGWTRVLERRDALIRSIDALLREFDAFLCPAVMSTAFAHSAPRSPIPVDGQMVESRFVDHYLFPFNITGHPALAFPAALGEDGLPIGLQLVARRWGDEHLLATAQAVVSVIGGFRVPAGME